MVADTRIVVGLGNPGRNYASTRHNLGFMVVDELARRAGESTARTRFRSQLLEARRGGAKLVLVKPQTYMNESGHAVREALNWYRAPMDRMIVVVDDLDLPFGQLRMRAEGSPGGHNGLKSIIEQMGDRAFPRLRIGIGRGGNRARAHVLSHFAPDEQRLLPEVVGAAADAVERWLDAGIVTTMNEVNARKSVLSAGMNESANPAGEREGAA